MVYYFMEKVNQNNLRPSTVLNKYYKPDYSKLFNKIKDIKRPFKNDILIALLDGKWHPEDELIRIAKKQQGGIQYMRSVSLGTIIQSINHNLKNNYLEKKIILNKIHYKIAENYVGLSRAAFRYTVAF